MKNLIAILSCVLVLMLSSTVEASIVTVEFNFIVTSEYDYATGTHVTPSNDRRYGSLVFNNTITDTDVWNNGSSNPKIVTVFSNSNNTKLETSLYSLVGENPYNGNTDIYGSVSTYIDFNLYKGSVSANSNITSQDVTNPILRWEHSIRLGADMWPSIGVSTPEDHLAFWDILTGRDRTKSITLWEEVAYYNDYGQYDTRQYTDGHWWSSGHVNITSITEHSAVPIPSTLLLFGTGLAGLITLKRKKEKLEGESQ